MSNKVSLGLSSQTFTFSCLCPQNSLSLYSISATWGPSMKSYRFPPFSPITWLRWIHCRKRFCSILWNIGLVWSLVKSWPHIYCKIFGIAIIHLSGTNPDDAAEKACVKNFIDFLEPHMSQFGDSLIKVYASSLLPSITTNVKYVSCPIHPSTCLCDIEGMPSPNAKFKSLPIYS